MLRSDDQVRFTAGEIEEARRLGIDLTGVKTMAMYSAGVIQLITTLEHDRPELLEKIARALCEATGRKMPAKLVPVT